MRQEICRFTSNETHLCLMLFQVLETVFDEYSGLLRQDAMLGDNFYRRFEGSCCLRTQISRSEDEAGISFETSISNCQTT
jgi:hypothetical protein